MDVSPWARTVFDRDVASEAASVKTTFSSWDACMEKSYCKYPVIIGIIIGSLIIISILWCFVRCCCCGLSCCCGCLSCFNACCPSPRGGRRNKNSSKYQDPPPPPPQQTNYQGYQPAPAFDNTPKFATFDAGSKKANGTVKEDALPAMPSWDQAKSKRVEDTDNEDLEMGRLDPPKASTGYAGSVAGSGYRGTESTTSLGTAAAVGAGAAGAGYGAGAYGSRQQQQSPYGQQGGYNRTSPTSGNSPYGGGLYTSNRAGPRQYGQQQQGGNTSPSTYGYGNAGGRGGGGAPQGQMSPTDRYRSPPPIAGTSPAAYNAASNYGGQQQQHQPYPLQTSIQPQNVYGQSVQNPDYLPASTSSHNLMSSYDSQQQQQSQSYSHSQSPTYSQPQQQQHYSPHTSPTSPRNRDPSEYFPARNQAPEPGQVGGYTAFSPGGSTAAFSDGSTAVGSAGAGGRPPSLLVAGRKPVPGTWREA